VLTILREGGYRTLSIKAIATHAGVPRTSIYRRWPSKQHLVADAVVSEMGEHPAPDTGSTRGDLLAVVKSLLRAFSGPLGFALPALVSDMAKDSELAIVIRAQVLDVRRQSMRQALNRAKLRGDVAHSLDTELLLDMLTGPFYFRTLFGHARIDRRMANRIVEYVLNAARHGHSSEATAHHEGGSRQAGSGLGLRIIGAPAR
jgi:AcrR family transcriptional regulator